MTTKIEKSNENLILMPYITLAYNTGHVQTHKHAKKSARAVVYTG